MWNKLITILFISLLVLAGCGTKADDQQKQEQKDSASKAIDTSDFPQLTNEVQENDVVVEMETSMGKIVIKLFPDIAPKAVENFVTHSKNGYYDGLIFHRVIEDFMIQGGDPRGNGTGGESIWGEPFEDEFSKKLFNFRGALSMANSGSDTNGSQFFIVQASEIAGDLIPQMEKLGYPEGVMDAYVERGGTPWLDFKHTVFGQVIDGMDVVDAIAQLEKDSNDKPIEDVVIKNIMVRE